jgi:hypothetical protein
MFASRKVEIHETDEAAVIATQSCYPVFAIPGFVLTFIFWLAFLVIFGGGALGYISPETATTPIRVFAGILASLWLAIGLWSGATLFRKAFARGEFQASIAGFSVRYVSFLGASRDDYAWDKIEAFTEVVTGGRFDRDIAMIVSGRHIALDYGLTGTNSPQAVEVLSRWLEKSRQKRANKALQATAAAPGS